MLGEHSASKTTLYISWSKLLKTVTGSHVPPAIMPLYPFISQSRSGFGVQVKREGVNVSPGLTHLA